MTQDALISSRIDADLKAQADGILSELGIKPSQAITMFYTQIVKQRGIPLELKIPNDVTIAALNEDLNNAARFKNADDLFDELDKEIQ